jgi:hypothetical protein
MTTNPSMDSLRHTPSTGAAMDRLAVPLAAVLMTWWAAIYLPGIGKGFIKDDFGWIVWSQVASLADMGRILTRANGFYRPAVSLSFTVDYALFGLNAMPYGLTNALLALLTAFSIARLARSLRMSSVAAVTAAGLWLLNPHGINMALLWISGRTALLLTLLATLAATAFIRGHRWRASLWAFLAMTSKEEAVLIPVILLGWSIVDAISNTSSESRRPSVLAAVRDSLPPFLPLVVYASLRLQSGAMTPASAPWFYRLSFDLRHILSNAGEYLDRSATFSLVVALLLTLIARRLPSVGVRNRRIMLFGTIWLFGGYAITVFLPVRSNLYACFPSVGVCLASAIWISLLLSGHRPIPLRHVLAGLLVVAVATVPVYWLRNQRWITAASVSTAALKQLGAVVPALPLGSTVVVYDRSDNVRESLEGAFGTLLPEAVTLTTKRSDLAFWIEPPLPDALSAGWHPPGPGATVHAYTFRHRTLTALEPPAPLR